MQPQTRLPCLLLVPEKMLLCLWKATKWLRLAFAAATKNEQTKSANEEQRVNQFFAFHLHTNDEFCLRWCSLLFLDTPCSVVFQFCHVNAVNLAVLVKSSLMATTEPTLLPCTACFPVTVCCAHCMPNKSTWKDFFASRWLAPLAASWLLESCCRDVMLKQIQSCLQLLLCDIAELAVIHSLCWKFAPFSCGQECDVAHLPWCQMHVFTTAFPDF